MTPNTIINADNGKTRSEYRAWNPSEVRRVARWWLSASAKRKQQAMAVGGFSEVLQQVYVDLLSHPPKDGYSLTTIVCHRTAWTLHCMFKRMRRVKAIGKCKNVVNRDVVTNATEPCDKLQRAWQTLSRLLDKRTAFVIGERLNGRSFVDLGYELGIANTRVSQIYYAGIERLRRSEAAKKLRQEVWF